MQIQSLFLLAGCALIAAKPMATRIITYDNGDVATMTGPAAEATYYKRDGVNPPPPPPAPKASRVITYDNGQVATITGPAAAATHWRKRDNDDEPQSISDMEKRAEPTEVVWPVQTLPTSVAIPSPLNQPEGKGDDKAGKGGKDRKEIPERPFRSNHNII